MPSNIHFGCMGNPIQNICSFCNTKEIQTENYNKYLYIKKNWKQMGFIREKYPYKKGHHVYFSKFKNDESMPTIVKPPMT